MKAIGIDARLYSQTGVGVYVRNLLYYLQEINIPDTRFFVYVMNDDKTKVRLDPKRFSIRPVSYRWHSIGEQIGFFQTLNHDNLDLMHFTYFSYPILYRKKFIATVHDITPLLYKTGKASTKNPLMYEIKHAIFQYIIANQVSHAVKIITPTESVRQQLIKFYGKKIENKIEAIYEGVDTEIVQAKENVELKKEFKKDFCIYVGNFYPHKNVERLVTAFAEIQTDIRLILVGPSDYFANRIALMIQKKHMQKKILFFHNPSKQDLVFFYQHAKALIHPSLSEGFGLPIIEACYYNLPIMASSIDVFKEILGQQYVAFDSKSVLDIKDKIEQGLIQTVPYDYQSIINKCSFKQMAIKINEIYQKSL